MARILLGVSGGIAAYKALELARLATKAGHGVRVLMTPAAERFVGAASFEGIVGAPVLIDEFERDPLRGTFPGDEPPAHDPIGHLALAANADAFLVAPASANTLAKLAAGICDSLLTTSFLACTAPRAVAPAMNDRMYADAATQANLATLRERGVRVIDPDTGALASRGEHGVGPPARPGAAARRGRGDAALRRGAAGTGCGSWSPPAAPGSRSTRCASSATAPAVAWAWRSPRPRPRRGAEVTLIAANVGAAAAARDRDGRGSRPRPSSRRRSASASRDCHVLLMAAAPADFRAAEPAATKISRAGAAPELRLEPTEDVLAGRRARAAATTRRWSASPPRPAPTRSTAPAQKLERKAVDAIVFNDVSRSEIGFDSELNEVTVSSATASCRSRWLEGRGRRGDPRPGGGAPRRGRKRDVGGS